MYTKYANLEKESHGIRIKNWKDIIGIRKSCQLAADCLKFVAPLVKSGVTTNFLNDELEKYMRSHGAIPASLGYDNFPKATCISVNEVICHGIPSDYVLKDGDILNIDVTTILNGYYGDTSTMFVVGGISEEAKKLLQVTKECLEIGIRQVRPNNYFGNIGYFINQHATKHGFSVVKLFCGHGTGNQFHEPPNIVHVAERNSGLKMKPGMIFTIEPMINVGVSDVIINEVDGWTASTKDGKLSAQYEHTILVTRSGAEVLTL